MDFVHPQYGSFGFWISVLKLGFTWSLHDPFTKWVNDPFILGNDS